MDIQNIAATNLDPTFNLVETAIRSLYREMSPTEFADFGERLRAFLSGKTASIFR